MSRQPAASDPGRHRIDAGGRALNVADVGCGAGARAAGLEIMFDHANAAALPWPDRSMAVCLAPFAVVQMHGAELLRVLRPGGVLYITTDKALNWFAFRWLRHRLARRGLRCLPGAPRTQLAVLKPAR